MTHYSSTKPKYALNGDTHVGFATLGEGPPDLVQDGIAMSHLERVSGMAEAGEILVSRVLPDLVAGSGIDFVERGEHELKGVPGRWQPYAAQA